MKARFETIHGMTTEITDCLMASGDIPSDERLQFTLRLCIDEIVGNIVNYAYNDRDGFLEIGTSLENNVLCLTFEDSGIPFNPLDTADPDITLPLEERPVGGLGIFLCKQLMDNMEYVYENGRNKLTIKKRIKMYNRQFTPERISQLKENEIFVFGSNLSGMHGGGAAYLAFKRFGAIWGQGVGIQGQSYAIPTMQGGVETIKPYVDEFISFARNKKDLLFFVTRIGCGIAGFKDEEIAPLFADALGDENIMLPKEFVDNLT